MCQLIPKLMYIYENNVFCTFLPNFILKINTTGILWYRGILWAYTCNLHLANFACNSCATKLRHKLHSVAAPSRLSLVENLWQEIFVLRNWISENHGMERADCRACVLSGVYNNVDVACCDGGVFKDFII